MFPDDGAVCLSMLLEEGHHKGTVSQHYSPSVTIRDLLLGLQTFLEEPNPGSVANPEACEMLRKPGGKKLFEARAAADAKAYESKLAAMLAKGAKA